MEKTSDITKDFLATLPTQTILDHLLDRFEVVGEGFIYAYYTFSDSSLKSKQSGHLLGGVGNHALQLGLAEMIGVWIRAQNQEYDDLTLDGECDDEGDDLSEK